MNKVILMGRLGNDPDLRETSAGSVCNFNLATTTRTKKGALTDWHRIVVWGKQAENAAQFLNKGSKALIEGSLKSRSYEDKEGNMKYITEVIGFSVTYLDSKDQQSSQDIGEFSEPPSFNNDDDDLPF
jgi:single-strand DNA-binding protein